jgi:hypothetical protein
MSNQLYAILLASFLGFAGLLVYWTVARRQTRVIVASIVIVLLGAWIVYALVPGRAGTRGDGETAAVVIAYVAMLLGMMAQYVYVQGERGDKKITFELMPFIMPILASPIVFIPLVSIAGEVGAGGAFTRQKLMVYLVAFQNGFFWKHFFDQHRRSVTGAPKASALSSTS